MSIHYPSAMQLVCQRLADIPATLIERLFWEDRVFREVCQDYAECIHMWEKYASVHTLSEASIYKQDYEALMEALEKEMRAMLMEAQGQPRQPR